MQWSWSSFGAGLLGGALLAALLWAATTEPDDARTHRVDDAPAGSAGTDEAGARGDRPRTSSRLPTDTPTGDRVGDAPTREPTPAIVRPSESGRRHVTPQRDSANAPVTGGQSTANVSAAPQEWVQAIANGAKLRLQDVRTKQTLRVSFSKVSGDWNVAAFMGIPANPAQAMLHYAKTRAAEATSDGGSPNRNELHVGESYAERAAGLGLALAAEPPAVDELLEIALDDTFPDLRGAALLALAEVGLDVPAVRALILESADDADRTLRLTAIELLPRLGDVGGRRASEILLSGDYTPQVLGPLTTAVADSDAAGSFLAASPPLDAALQVVSHLAVRFAAPGNDRDVRLAASLPDLVRPLLESPESGLHAIQVLSQLAALGHGAFLRGVAASPLYSPSVRGAAATAALAQETTRDDGIAAIAAIVSDPNANVALVRQVLAAVDASIIANPTLRSALEDAAENHPSAWVRSDAKEKLGSLTSNRGGTLVIHDASYGIGEAWVDVTAELRAAVIGGALAIQASNGIAGDPKPGHAKTLRVEYTFDGTRHLSRVTEGQRLRIP